MTKKFVKLRSADGVQTFANKTMLN